MHCHFLVAEADAIVASLPAPPAPAVAPSHAAGETAHYNAELIRSVYWPTLTEVDRRLADMDAMGVDIQAISPSPTQYYYTQPAEAGEAIVACINERIAGLCAERPDRFVGLGGVALQHPDLACKQLRHAVRDLGLRGVEISTMVDGVSIDDRRFDGFWSEAERLGAVVLLHPLGTTVGPRLDPYYLSNVIGQPLETMIALSRLIMGGHFDRHPDLKLCAVHGGGYLPGYRGRADHAWKVRPECDRCAHPPSHYLRKLWYDSLVFDPAELAELIAQVGADRVVIGTDYPFDMGDYDPIARMEALTDLSDVNRAAIMGGNACALLGITQPQLLKEQQ